MIRGSKLTIKFIRQGKICIRLSCVEAVLVFGGQQGNEILCPGDKGERDADSIMVPPKQLHYFFLLHSPDPEHLGI